MGGLVVVTHNIEQKLSRTRAAGALEAVLGLEPDAVALQEWYPHRWTLLRPSGRVSPLVLGRSRTSSEHEGTFDWFPALLGGCVVGLRRDRFGVLTSRVHLLSRPGRSDRGEGLLALEPARIAVVVRCTDRATGRLMAFVSFHLVHGVQLAGQYRPDRPRLAARHQGEVARLLQLVQRLEDEGHLVVAAGDSNFEGLRLAQLASVWTGHEEEPGSLGRRRVDDVHAPGAPSSMGTVTTTSDHRAVVARYADEGAWP